MKRANSELSPSWAGPFIEVWSVASAAPGRGAAEVRVFGRDLVAERHHERHHPAVGFLVALLH